MAATSGSRGNGSAAPDAAGPSPVALSNAGLAHFTLDEELDAYRRDAADPPLRGKGRPDVWHGPHRRLLPSLYRPGGRDRRHDLRASSQATRRSPAIATTAICSPAASTPKAVMAELTGRAARLFPRARAARCTCSRRSSTSSAAMASSARRCRSAPALPSPIATAATTTSASPISATARPTRGRSMRASTWRSCGSCRSST